jgi:Ca2+-transporting ATPase
MEYPKPEILHAAVPGRVRFGVTTIRGRPKRADNLARLVRGLPGVRAAGARSVTGSLIVNFDPSIPLETVRGQVANLLPGIDEPAPATAQEPAAHKGRRTDSAKITRFRRETAHSWHAMPGEEAARCFNSHLNSGLSEKEALSRLRRSGPNLTPHEAGASPFQLFAKQFEGLPVMMLAGSAAVSVATGGMADAVATLSVVVVNGVLGYVTEGQAERTIHSLTGQSDHPVHVVRDGVLKRIPASHLVRGDMIALATGGLVPADARVTHADGLMVDESALTGESMPSAKSASEELAVNTPIGDRSTMLYAGTIVAEGKGRAIVVATGAQTEVACLQKLSTTAARPQAPVEAELDELGGKLAIASMAACAVFAGIGLVRGYSVSMILKDALALAVAAVPEGLPMVATTTLSLGLRRMQRKGILIRQLSAVESMGAVQVLCLDKTGTLTQNRMKVVSAIAGHEEARPEDPASLAALAEVAVLNNDGNINDGRATGSSQTELAILEFALAQGIDADALRKKRPRLREIARKPGQPWMATFHRSDSNTDTLITLKGAPEEVLARCDWLLIDGRTVPLDGNLRRRIISLNEKLAARPARVIGFARGTMNDQDKDPSRLVFAGMLAMVDPVRKSARALIRKIRRAGIRPVLITGDQAATAAAVAAEVELNGGRPLRVIDSTSITDLSPELLAGLAQDAHVFARVASHQKLAIVKALQASGRIVAMTGDGVNDAPALAAANVGIAMGESGTDLARDVANVVIRDDNLETLVEAIAQGRAIYRNIRRSLEYLVTTNMSEIAVSILEALHGPGELETPMELLWINLVTDVFPGLGLALADPDEDVMDRPPRGADETIVPARDFSRMAQDSGIIAVSALAAHFVGLARYGAGPETRGMTFLTLSQAQLLYTLVCQRSDPRKLHPDALFENRTLDLAVLGSSALGALPFFSPLLRRLLGIARLKGADIAVSLGAAAIPLAAVLARRSVQLHMEPEEVSHA